LHALLQQLADFFHPIRFRETVQRIRQWIPAQGIEPLAQRSDFTALGDGEQLPQVLGGEPRRRTPSVFGVSTSSRSAPSRCNPRPPASSNPPG
jgi:hypothetical protein